jgi:alanyl-tRNA synthetase
MIKTRQELIQKYINFFKKKHHKHIPSASLIPENDPTVLFTTAGMHPLVPFFTGQKHPLGKRLVNVQKCIRTIDIDEVGDSTHHTLFEMLGNWSLGDYWKEDAINYTYEFLTKELKIPHEKLAVSCFKGSNTPPIPKDTESEKIWLSLNISKERIAFLGKSDNWWGPAGETGPCGPNTEIFYWTNLSKPAPKKFFPKDDNWVEIGNNVLLQFNKNKSGNFSPLKQKTVDFGGGVERILSVLNNLNDGFQSPAFLPIIKQIETISNKSYSNKSNNRSIRIIADHIKAAVFILGDDKQISPSNIGQGYVLRRLLRRAIRHGKTLGINNNFTVKVAKSILPIYPDYQELKKNQKFIFEKLESEENKFRETLEKGLKEFEKVANNTKLITGKEAFLLFQSYGFPIEMTQELANELGVVIDLEEYNDEFRKHQDLSRSTSSGTFKSGLADDSKATRKLHTATHLLNEVLRRVLGNDVKQRGSNITPERLRFDFNFPRKLTPDEISKIESLLNSKIKASLKVDREEMPLSEAIKSKAQSEFGAKYPELVSVYTILDPKEKFGWFSREICTGPHVKNTSELGHFKIIKEQSSASGIRRIKAILEE